MAAVSVHLSDQRLTGVLAVCHDYNKAVATSAKQTPPPDIVLVVLSSGRPNAGPLETTLQ